MTSISTTTCWSGLSFAPGEPAAGTYYIAAATAITARSATRLKRFVDVAVDGFAAREHQRSSSPAEARAFWRWLADQNSSRRPDVGDRLVFARRRTPRKPQIRFTAPVERPGCCFCAIFSSGALPVGGCPLSSGEFAHGGKRGQEGSARGTAHWRAARERPTRTARAARITAPSGHAQRTDITFIPCPPADCHRAGARVRSLARRRAGALGALVPGGPRTPNR